MNSDPHALWGKCFHSPCHLLSYTLSLAVAQTLHQEQADSALGVLGLGRHPRLGDLMRCDLLYWPWSWHCYLWAESRLQWEVWRLKVNLSLDPKDHNTLGNLIDVWKVLFPWGSQASPQHPWNQS